MAIDQRQIYDLNKLVPNIISDGLDYGDDPGLMITRDEESNEIHIGMVLPTKLNPAYVEPEPEPEPEPVTSDDIDAPTKELKEYHINDIVRFVRAGYGSKFPVGSMIPIKLQNFLLTSSNRDQRSYGGHSVKAVVLGHDHNIAKENPALKHTMTLALMYRNNGDITERPMAWASPSEFTDRVIFNVEAAFLSALPPEWQDAVVKTTKTGVTADDGKLLSKTAAIFVPSYYEVYGYQGYIDSQDKASWEGGAQLQYEYFQKKGFPSNFYYYVGSSVFTPNYSTIPFLIASRSPVSKQEGSRMLLQVDAGPRCGFDIYKQGAKTKSYVVTNNYKSPFLNASWVSQTGNSAYYIGDDHGSSYDIYAMTSYVNVTVGLNQRQLGIGTGTSHIIRDIGDKRYLFTGAGIIPCFNIG